MSISVLVVEDHPLVATGLQLALQARDWRVATASGPRPDDVIEAATRLHPDCVLLDLHLGDELGNGIGLVAPLRDAGARVVMLTAETDRFLLASCVEAGAEGWIGKDAFLDEIVSSVERVLAGSPLLGRTQREAWLDDLRLRRESMTRALSPFERLTPRERAVLGALVDGLSAEEIAEKDFVALTTVRSQIRGVLQKLGVRSQLAAVALANRSGWAPPPDGPAGDGFDGATGGAGGNHQS
ncbi:MAG TPA: response regulator transcription factor [Acidimicrobiales bacterium]